MYYLFSYKLEKSQLKTFNIEKRAGGLIKAVSEVVLNTPVFNRVNKGVDQEKKKQELLI